MNTYVELAAADVPTRQAAALTGVARATATRAASRARRPDPEPPSARPAPANKLSSVERSLVLSTLNSDEFVDKPPLQSSPILRERGEYVGSVSTL